MGDNSSTDDEQTCRKCSAEIPDDTYARYGLCRRCYRKYEKHAMDVRYQRHS